MNLPPALVLLAVLAAVAGIVVVILRRDPQLRRLIDNFLRQLARGAFGIASTCRDRRNASFRALARHVRGTAGSAHTERAVTTRGSSVTDAPDPARRAGTTPGHAIGHELIGVAALAITAAGVVAGDVGLVVTTVCGMLSECGDLPMTSAGVVVATALISCNLFWGAIGADLIGLTHTNRWPNNKPFRWFSGGCFALAVLVLVAAAVYREVVWSQPQASADELVARTAIWRQLTFVGGGVLITVTSAVALVAILMVIEVVAATAVLGGFAALWTGAELIMRTAAWAASLARGSSDDLIDLLRRDPRVRHTRDIGAPGASGARAVGELRRAGGRPRNHRPLTLYRRAGGRSPSGAGVVGSVGTTDARAG